MYVPGMGRAIVGRDVGEESKSIRSEEIRLQREMEKQADLIEKKGAYGSVGRKIGEKGVGLLLAPFLGPAGLKVGEMAGGYFGGKIGESFVDTSKAGLETDVSKKGKYLTEERRELGESAKLAREDYDKAMKGMKQQNIFSSIYSPLSTGLNTEDWTEHTRETGRFVPETGEKEMKSGYEYTGGSIWDRLLSSPEYSTFFGGG